MGNVALVHKRGLSSFRMLAMGTWRTAKDPSVYGAIEINMDASLRFLEAFRARTGKRATVTHLMAMAIARVLHEVPDANAVLRFWRVYLRQDVDVFFQVAMKDPESGQVDLSGVTLRRVDQKSLTTIVDEFEAAAAKVRAGKDAEKESTRQLFKKMPGFIVGPVLDLVAFLTYTLNLNLSFLGLPKDPFGGVMVTNVGSLGLEEAYAPLVPYSRVPLLVGVGAIRKVPVVAEHDTLVVAHMMRLCATFDHRLLDGAHAAKMVAILKDSFAHPDKHFGGEGVDARRS